MVNISQEQFALLSDRDFLLEKKRISEQLVSILAAAENNLKTFLADTAFDFPPTSHTKAGKISKGESYRDLPYFVLDFPRLFSKEEVFAYRSMIRWGHELSFTLHLAGASKSHYEKAIKLGKSQLKECYICTNASPWEYHFEQTNYQPIQSLTQEVYESMLNKDFVKISYAQPLEKVNDFPIIALETFKEYLHVLQDVSDHGHN